MTNQFDERFEWKSEGGFLAEAGEMLYYLMKVFAVFVLVFLALVRHAMVDGKSMQPTFSHEDRVLVSDFCFVPSHGDVIAFYEENYWKKPLIKRVIGVAGDTVDLTADGRVVLNGQVLDEDYIAERIDAAHRGDQHYPVTVPEGCIMVMGDNRNGSHDSRWTAVDFVDTDNVIGKVLVRFYPTDRMEVFW